MIYLDNAATSFPKPPAVAEAMAEFLAHSAGNPGRSGHAIAVAAQRTVADARRLLASFLGAPEPTRVVFTQNATEGINLALWGLLRPGDRVVTTEVEHNAVARPLSALSDRGVTVTRVRCGTDGALDLADLERALKAAPARLVAMVHASNVSGTILPAAEAARLAHDHGALFLLDAAQTAGVLPLDVARMGVDLLAFPGHKALLGPTGTGGLYVAPGVKLAPLRQGGTGIHSEEERQPEDLPEALEAGTLNTVGIAGLAASLRYLATSGVETVRSRELALTARLLSGLREVRGVRVHGTGDPRRQVGTVSISIDGWDPADAAAVLDSSFGIAVRAGLHCAPLAHRTLGTFPAGTIRISVGCFTTEEHVDCALSAVRALASSAI